MIEELINNEWKKQTCKTCNYQVNDLCRLSPPVLNVASVYSYPNVNHANAWGYELACSHWKNAQE